MNTPTQKSVKSYKAFNPDMTCRDFQFKLGETYTHEGSVEACYSGFHACLNPIDVFLYYPLTTSKFCVVESSGKISTHKRDSKISAEIIKIEKELTLTEYIKECADYIIENSNNTESDTGYRSAATNTGKYSAATNTGYQSAATNTGNFSAATNTGYQSAATNTGDQSAATNTGDQSAATNTGYQSAAIVEGKNSIAVASGKNSKAKAGKGSVIVLCSYSDEGNLKFVKSAIAGKDKIKSDTFYTLSDDGKFVEYE